MLAKDYILNVAGCHVFIDESEKTDNCGASPRLLLVQRQVPLY